MMVCYLQAISILEIIERALSIPSYTSGCKQCQQGQSHMSDAPPMPSAGSACISTLQLLLGLGEDYSIFGERTGSIDCNT